MASNDYSADGAPMQPGLRSFVVYDALPGGFIASEVLNDDSIPHLRKGEFVVVDTSDKTPAVGELFLVQWKSARENEPSIVMMQQRRVALWIGGVGPGVPTDCWFVGPCAKRRMMALTGEEVGPALRWADGPYQDEYLGKVIIGRIVGIYEPDFRRMLGRQS